MTSDSERPFSPFLAPGSHAMESSSSESKTGGFSTEELETGSSNPELKTRPSNPEFKTGLSSPESKTGSSNAELKTRPSKPELKTGVDPAPHHTLALDVGGTGIKAGLVTRDGKLTRTWRRATRIDRGPDAVIATIVDFAAELVEQAAADGTPVAAAGFALPGIINEQTGVGVFSATIGWRDVPFRALLTERLAVPVAIGHDVRAGGVAEARIGAGRGSSRFVFLPLGTSIGGAIMIDGKPNLGPHGLGGEFGHFVVRPGGIPCGCGLAGCLAQYSSAGAVAARYAAAAGTENTGALDVAAKLTTGDPIAVRIWDEAVDVLADALLTTAALLDPGRVVIGGGLAEAGDLLMVPLAEALTAKATYHALPELVTAELGDLAGCLGAGLLAWDLVS